MPTPAALALATSVARVNRLRGSTDDETNTTAVRYFCRTGTYSIEKARTVLGYDPQVDLDEGMRRSEAWLREVGVL
jgi:nucleoside-diphosphate-sugar epimerase